MKFALLDWMGLGSTPELTPPIPVVQTPIYSELPMDDQDFRDIVAEFIARLQERMATLAQLQSAHNWDAIKPVIHWLKGAGGSVGFPILTALSLQIELALEADNLAKADQILCELLQTAPRISMPPRTTFNG